jgi:hypothetical protein
MNEINIEKVRQRALPFVPGLAVQLQVEPSLLWQFCYGFRPLPDHLLRAVAKRVQVEVTS